MTISKLQVLECLYELLNANPEVNACAVIAPGGALISTDFPKHLAGAEFSGSFITTLKESSAFGSELKQGRFNFLLIDNEKGRFLSLPLARNHFPVAALREEARYFLVMFVSKSVIEKLNQLLSDE